MAERFEKKLLSSRFAPGTSNGNGPLLDPRGRYRVYRVGDYKLARHFVNGNISSHLFDLQEDPGEMTDLAADPNAATILTQIEDELKNWEIVLKLPALGAKAVIGGTGGGGAGTAKKGSAGKSENQLSDEAREQLKALGYME